MFLIFFKKKEEETMPRRRSKSSRTAFSVVTVLAMALGIAVLCTTIVVPIQYGGTVRIVPDTPPVDCYDPVFVQNQPITTTQEAFISIAYNPTTGLIYGFGLNYAGSYTLSTFNVSAYPETGSVPYEANILDGTVFPGISPSEYIYGAHYDENTEDFIVVSSDFVYRMDPNGTVTSTMFANSDYWKPMITSSGRLFATDYNSNYGEVFFEIDPVTGSVIGSPRSFSFVASVENVVFSFGNLFWDSTTQAAYVIYEADPYNEGINYAELRRRYRGLARFDVDTGECVIVCSKNNTSIFSFSQFAITETGRTWFVYPNRIDSLINLQTTEKIGASSFQTNTSTWSVECQDARVSQDLAVLPIGQGMTIMGTGCNGSAIRDERVGYRDGFIGSIPAHDILQRTAPNVGDSSQTVLSSDNATMQEANEMHHDMHPTMLNYTTIVLDEPVDENDPFARPLEEGNPFFQLPPNVTLSKKKRKKRNTITYPNFIADALLYVNDATATIGGYSMHGYSNAVVDNSGNYWLLMFNNVTYNGLTLIGDTTAIDLSAIGTSNCLNVMAPYQLVVRVDHEADRLLVAWVNENAGQYWHCFATTQTNDPSGMWDTFEFSITLAMGFPNRLDVAVWGDYYLVSYDTGLLTTGAQPNYGWYVLERQRMLFGGGMPRMVDLPRHSLGTSAFVNPSLLNQDAHNGGPGPFQTAFPCGAHVVMSATGGGVLGMVACQSVNFDTSANTVMETSLVIGTWNDGSSGSCANIRQCISLAGGPPGDNLDPLSYEPGVAFRYFPATGESKLAVGITIDADGTPSAAQIIWGEFTLNSTGMIYPTNGMHEYQVRNTFSSTFYDTFGPSFQYLPSGILVMVVNYEYDFPSRVIAYRYPSHPSGQFLANEIYGTYGTGALRYRSDFTPRNYIATVPNFDQAFVYGFQVIYNTGFSGGLLQYSHRNRIYEFNFTDNYEIQQIYAQDACGTVLSCASRIIQGLVNFVLPPHVSV